MLLSYDEICLVPSFSKVTSRKKCDTSVYFGRKKFDLPIVPANMKSVITIEMAEFLAKNNYFYIMHRFDIDIINFIYHMQNKNLFTSISIGVNQDSYDVLKDIYNKNLHLDYVTVDIAHGHSKKMLQMLKYLKNKFSDTFIIAGNVCTTDGVDFLYQNGADAIKVGIGPGLACTTRLKTGFWKPQFSAVLECAKQSKVPLIADGGIREHADIAKAIVAGADMVMIGSILAGTNESGGYQGSFQNAVYYGSASEYNKKHRNNIEGKLIEIEPKGPISERYAEITQDLQSSISYSGGHNISSLHNCNWVSIK